MLRIEFQLLNESSLSLIRTIDRREEIFEVYYLTGTGLRLQNEYYLVPGFTAEEMDQIIERQHSLLRVGGCVIGAFCQGTLIGVASVENRPRGNRHFYRKLDILYVSYEFRGQGIGSYLLNLCQQQARRLGGQRLYISSIPSRFTVDFYRRHGAILAQELDQELVALEPDDIHLELTV